MVAVRGGSQVKAKVIDNENGTYQCEFKCSVAGLYSITVSLYGAPLRCFGVPPTSSPPPAEGFGVPMGANPRVGRGMPAGTGVAVVKAARDASAAELDMPELS